jgi:hypothetical protein
MPIICFEGASGGFRSVKLKLIRLNKSVVLVSCADYSGGKTDIAVFRDSM